MIRRSLAFVLAVFVLGIPLQAQTPAPDPGTKGEGLAFSMFFDGDGAYLGVQTAEVTKDNFAKFGLREVRGVAVEKVLEGSPAEKAGLQNGDVIVKFNNEEVTSTRKLTRLLGEVAPDHQVKLTVLRGGAEREIIATAGKRPMPKFEEGGFTWNMPAPGQFPPGDFPRMDRMPRMENFPQGAPGEPFAFAFGSHRRIGANVTTLSKQLSEHFGVASGVMIDEVLPDTPAAKAGLKAGDIIVEVDGKEVKSEMDLSRGIQGKKEGHITLTIVRDRNRQTVRVTPEEIKNDFNRMYQFPNGQSGFVGTPGPFNWISLPTSIVRNGLRFPCRWYF
ncbi:MAG TPA: PDZ domain-containing protein [Pyrinomonadaceae bacterium]|nr:PDZ domain-containing protein [Pyrinomonadaceae bacterium]